MVEAKEQTKERVYVSRMVHQGFSMPVKVPNETTGKMEILHKRDAHGNKTLGPNGQFVPVMKTIVFENVSRSWRLGYYSEYRTSDPEEIAHLEKLCEDPGTPIIHIDDYKREKNPEMWKAEKERDAIKAEKDMVIRAKDEELSTSARMIAELQEKIRKIEQRGNQR